MKKYIIFLLLFIPSVSFAQDAVSDWEKSVALGFNLTNGNSNTTLLNFNSKAEKKTDRETWRFELSVNHGETENEEGVDEKTHEEVLFDSEYQNFIDERNYYGLGVSFENDEVADIDYRVFIKPVFGHYFLKDEKYRFNIEAGPAYVFEKLGGEKEDYLAPRIADRFEWKISDTSKFFQSAEALLSVEDGDDYILNAELGLEAAINSALSLVVSVKNNYTNLPAEGREKNDVKFVTSLKYVF